MPIQKKKRAAIAPNMKHSTPTASRIEPIDSLPQLKPMPATRDSLESRVLELEAKLKSRESEDKQEQHIPSLAGQRSNQKSTQPMMPALIEELHTSIEVLGARLKSIETRLDSILRSEPEDLSLTNGAHPIEPMPQTLSAVAYATSRIHGLIRFIDGIDSRIAV